MVPILIYKIFWIFYIYSFIGWCAEVGWAALDTGKLSNRGFLVGPVCPIYGCGMLLVISILTPLKDNLLILFAGSILLTTALELIVGWGMEKIFHHHWWDYSNYPFNFKGYICLKFSLMWGFACTFVMKILQPGIFKIVNLIPVRVGIVFLVIFSGIFLADAIITIVNILKFNKKLKLLLEVEEKLRHVSDSIAEDIYEGVTDAIEHRDKVKDTINTKAQKVKEDRARERAELTEKYNALMEKHKGFQKRLLQSFPNLTSVDYSKILDDMKEKIAEEISKRK